MTRKVIVVHIGYPKTGSTTIQRWLNDNPDALAASGVRYIRAGRTDRTTGAITSIQHIGLINELRGPTLGDTRSGEMAAARAEIRTCAESNVVFSSEQFAFLTESSTHRLVKMLSRVKRRIKLVVYLRDQDRYLESLYNSRMMRANEPFLGDFDSLVEEQVQGPMLSYGERLAMFAQELGEENLSVATFGGEATSGLNLLKDFFRRIGCRPLPPIGEMPPQNQSRDVRAVHVWERLMHETPLAQDTDEARSRVLGRLRAAQAERGWGDAKPVFFTPQARRELLSRYVAQNAEVNAKYGTELVESLDGRDDPPSNWPPTGLLSDEDITAVRTAFGLDLSGAGG